MKEYETFIVGVRKGQVGRLTPGDGETARGIALRVSRAGKRAGKMIETWVADGAVYFRLGGV